MTLGSSIAFGWPIYTLPLAVFLLLALHWRHQGQRWRDPAFLLPLVWPIYLLHQFEEHGIDLLGRRYAFLATLCDVLGHKGGTNCPADPTFIFSVNVVAVQLSCLLAWFYAKRRPLVAACAWGIPAVNAMVHILASLRSLSYNPGLLTSILLFIPASWWMFHMMLTSGVLRGRGIALVVFCGVATHVVLIASLLLYRAEVLPYWRLQVLNGANGLWPLLGLCSSQTTTTAEKT